ncbi:glycosyltransferase [Roseococcus sp. SYP-B2431]|uniref:glycosyltransferase n=1 Tax=Roseococcus sp. SYP-B2431 TaxID=2496640 RepID=UPI00103A1FB0|nr:glycosyltransferase [Roseococcus sp. SYP-B2431]TCH96610.1 glycosyltransferase [Roseococcus sp. SYP-B2431]
MILLLSAAHPPDDMRVVRKEGAALAAAGWRVMHLCPGAGGPLPPVGGVAIDTVAGRSRLRRLPALYRRAVALRPAVIHASEPDSWAVALLAGARCGARVVLDVHEHYPSRLDGRLPAALRPVARAALRLAMRAMGRAADAVVLAKEGLAADFTARTPLVAVRNHALVPAGLPRREHRDGPITLLHLGAIGVRRGWPQLLAAMALAPAGTRLLVIGRFTDGSEADFREAAERAGLAGRIEVAGWMPAEAALARAAAEADVNLVLFQPGEENHRLALPHKLFDGMAIGLPVIAPDFATGVAGIVRGAGCGVLVDVGSPACIAAAVTALTDRAARVRLGDAGWRAARGPWGWAAEAERLVELYRGLTAPGRARDETAAAVPDLPGKRA